MAEKLSDRPYCAIDIAPAPSGKDTGLLQGGAVGSAFLSAFL